MATSTLFCVAIDSDRSLLHSPIFVSPDTPLPVAIAQLHASTTFENEVPCLVVGDTNHGLGIVSDRTIAAAAITHPCLQQATVAEVMTPAERIIELEDTQNICTLLSILREPGSFHLLVQNLEQQIVGVVSRTDILAAIQLLPTDHVSCFGATSYCTLMQRMNEGVVIVDAEGFIQFVNDRYCQGVGYTREELIGKNECDLLAQPDDRNLIESKRALRKEGIWDQYEVQVQTKTGDRRWWQISGSPLMNSTQKLYGSIGIITDITDRKLTEARLRDLTQLQQAILNSANYTIISTDLNGVIQTFNAKAERILEYSTTELVGRATPELFHDPLEVEQRAQTLSAELGQRIAPGFEVFVIQAKQGISSSREWTYISRSGKRTPILLSVTAMCDRLGNITGFLGIGMDITEQKQLENERRKLASIVENSSDLMGISNLNGNMIFLNQAGQNLIGLDGMAAVQKTSLFEYLVPDDRHQAETQILKTVKAQGRWSGEVKFQHQQTGAEIPVLWNLFLIRNIRTGQPLSLAMVAKDITELKLAQTTLQQAEARFRRLLANVPGMVYQYVLHPDGSDDFPFVGYQCQDIFEVAQADALRDARILWATTHPDDITLLQASTQESATHLHPWTMQWRIITPSGNLKWVQGFSLPERQANGDILWDGVIVDVSDRQRAEMELAQSYQRTINILESITDAFMTLDQDWRMTYLNPQALHLFQCSLDELLHRNIWEVFPEAINSRFDLEYHRAMSEQVTVRFEAYYPPMGMWFDVRAYPTAEGLLVFFNDISDRRRLEEERNQFFTLPLDLLGIANFDGYFRQVNPAVTEILGYTPEEFMATSFLQFVHPDDLASTQAELNRLNQGQVVMTFENRYRCKDGSYRWLAWRSVPSPEQQLIYAVGRDITDQKATEAALRRSRDELEQRVIERTSELQNAYQRLSFHVDNSPLAIIEWDQEFRVCSWSEQSTQIFGWTFEEVQGQTFTELVLVYKEDLPLVLSYVDDLLGGKASNHIQNRNYTKDGRIIYCEWYNSVLKNESGQMVSLLSLVLDVTARQQALQALQASEQRFSTAFHASPVPLSITTFPHSRHLDVNDAWIESTGYDRMEAIGHTSTELKLWDASDERDRFLAELNQKGSVRNMLMHSKNKNGDIQTILLSSDRIELDGHPCLLSACFDISDRIQAERELRLLQTITQAITEAEDFESALAVTLNRICQVSQWNYGEVWIPNPAEQCLSLSPAWYSDHTPGLDSFRRHSETYTFSKHQGIPGRVWATQQPEWMANLDTQSVTQFCRIETAQQSKLKAAFGVPILANQQVVAVLVFFTVMVREPDEKLLGLITSISEQLGLVIMRKQAEQALRDSKEFSDRLIASLQDGFSLLDTQGVHVEVNQAFCDMMGFNLEELIGVGIPHPYWAPEHRADMEHIFANLVNNVLDEVEVTFMRKNGQRFEAIVTPSVLRDQQGNVTNYLALVKDISHLKHIEEELRKSRDQLEQRVQDRTAELASVNSYLQEEIINREKLTAQLQRSNQELEQFAYIASHDLQEPLRAITSYTQLLERKYRDKLDEKADKYIHYVVDGATHMQQLIQDLLTYSRVGRHELEWMPTDCNAVMRRVERSLSVAIAEAQATITYPELPTLRADTGQLTQLFQNLVNNAIKYRGDAPPIVQISATQRDQDWLFAIHDNGIGIDPQYQERIFIIFQRLHSRRHYSGTGIGLAVCQKIVDRHGGKIWVESQPDQGSTFYFTLPHSPDRLLSDVSSLESDMQPHP